MTIQLRPDQFQLKSDIYNGWQDGQKFMLGVLPTGGGKSIIVSDIVNDGNMLGLQQCVIAHRKELVGQMSLHVARRGIKHRIIGPKDVVAQIVASHREEFNGYSFVNPNAHCSVAGVDTLVARQEVLKPWAEQIDQWVIDEAHHVLRHNKWGRACTMFTRARGLGVTASPWRGDGMGLGVDADGVFDAMVVGPTMRELIIMGALCDYEIAIPEGDFYIDEDDLPPSGDFTPKKMREASKRSHIVGDVVTEYIKRAYGKRGICFATDVETAQEIAQKFNEYGISAAAVSAETPSDVRDDFIKRFKRGQLMMLVNVDLFGEGFDVPAVEVVIMARPTASLSVYLQQFGRALRTLQGKLYGLVIDHVSNWKRHGFPDKPHAWTLDRRQKRSKQEKDPEDVPLRACLGCSKPYPRVYACCPHCGKVPEIQPMDRGNLEKIDGDLILLDRARLEEMRKDIEMESPASVAARVAKAVGNNIGMHAREKQVEKHAAQQRLRNAIAQWAGIQRYKGRDDQQSHRRFYLTAGMDVLTALHKDRSTEEFNAMAAKVEGWCSL